METSKVSSFENKMRRPEDLSPKAGKNLNRKRGRQFIGNIFIRLASQNSLPPPRTNEGYFNQSNTEACQVCVNSHWKDINEKSNPRRRNSPYPPFSAQITLSNTCTTLAERKLSAAKYHRFQLWSNQQKFQRTRVPFQRQTKHAS